MEIKNEYSKTFPLVNLHFNSEGLICSQHINFINDYNKHDEYTYKIKQNLYPKISKPAHSHHFFLIYLLEYL